MSMIAARSRGFGLPEKTPKWVKAVRCFYLPHSGEQRWWWLFFATGDASAPPRADTVGKLTLVVATCPSKVWQGRPSNRGEWNDAAVRVAHLMAVASGITLRPPQICPTVISRLWPMADEMVAVLHRDERRGPWLGSSPLFLGCGANGRNGRAWKPILTKRPSLTILNL